MLGERKKRLYPPPAPKLAGVVFPATKTGERRHGRTCARTRAHARTHTTGERRHGHTRTRSDNAHGHTLTHIHGAGSGEHGSEGRP